MVHGEWWDSSRDEIDCNLGSGRMSGTKHSVWASRGYIRLGSLRPTQLCAFFSDLCFLHFASSAFGPSRRRGSGRQTALWRPVTTTGVGNAHGEKVRCLDGGQANHGRRDGAHFPCLILHDRLVREVRQSWDGWCG